MSASLLASNVLTGAMRLPAESSDAPSAWVVFGISIRGPAIRGPGVGFKMDLRGVVGIETCSFVDESFVAVSFCAADSSGSDFK